MRPTSPRFTQAKGWDTIQTGITRPPQAPSALAANYPLNPNDPAGSVPINSLRKLPANGIVIDAVLYPHSQLRFLNPAAHPPRSLPLRLADATLRERWEGQPHPGIVDFSIGARINGYGVEVHVYLGTSHPGHRLRTMAQRELNNLVIPPPN